MPNNAYLLRTYGITSDEYDELLEFQEHQCAICLRPFTPSRLPHVDHNHKTGNVRGLLCNRCNGLLGAINEDKHALMRAGIYLTHPSADFLWEDPKRPADAPPLEYVT